MTDKKYFEENGYKWSYEKTDKTPYYYDTEFKGRIWCDHTLFRLLHSMDEAEYKRQDEESRCVILNEKGLPIKCRLKCSTECPFGLSYSRTGSPISIEAIQEGNSHIDFVDISTDPKQTFYLAELKNKVREILAELNDVERFIYISIRFEEKTERDVAKRLGISQPAVHKKLLKISKTVEEKIKKFLD